MIGLRLMSHKTLILRFSGLLWFAMFCVPALQGAGPSELSNIIEQVRTTLPDLPAAEVSRAILAGDVREFSPRLVLRTAPASASPNATNGLIAKAELLQASFAWLVVSAIEPGFSNSLWSAWNRLGKSTRLKGLIIDLRNASGFDYEEAAAAANRFAWGDRPLLDWGAGSARSKPSAERWTLPVVALVSEQTAGAAEALAALVRDTHAGVMIGQRTAGQARAFKEYPLGDGRTLWVASADLRIGLSTTLGAGGLTPDVAVPGSAAPIPPTVAPPVRRPLLNEAELVRRHRTGGSDTLDGTNGGTLPTNRPPASVLVTDPVLGRAVDLLKVLAMFRPPK